MQRPTMVGETDQSSYVHRQVEFAVSYLVCSADEFGIADDITRSVRVANCSSMADVRRAKVPSH